MRVTTLADKRILIIGNGDLRQIAVLPLEQAGSQIMVAATDVDVPRLVLEVSPHLVLLSEESLGRGDTELLSLLRKLTDAPIVVVGSGGKENLVRLLEEGADVYLNRSVTPRKLLAYARALLRRHSPGNANNGEPYLNGHLAI